MSVSLHTKCRFCDTKLPGAFLDLGLQPPANNLCITDKHTDPDEFYPLKVTRCSECGLAQLTHIIEPKVMFSHYLYTPSEGGQSFKHFDGLAEKLTIEFELRRTVIDIGSNNGLILRRFQARRWTVIGVEPAKNLAEQTAKDGIFTINDFWGYKASSMILDKFQDGVDLVTAINVFAHVLDNHDFVRNVKRVLKPDGLFVIEVPSFLTMLREGTFDLVYL